MSNTQPDAAQLSRLITDTILGPDFRRATFGGAIRGRTAFPWLRVVVHPVEIRGQPHLQFSYFDARKNLVKNYSPAEIGPHLDEILAAGFAGIHLSTRAEEVDIRTSKRGKVIVGRRQLASPLPAESVAHNRSKSVPLPEGRANRLLETMGVLTRGGQVRPTMRAKYTQINEFLRQIEYVIEAAGLRDLGRPLTILDCGCGASYLTLAAHFYLNELLGIEAHILGVDINEEVIRKSVERAERLGAEGLQFTCDRIGAVQQQADLVLALHACDTATDDALAQAITGKARAILSVPCCHHHLNDQLRAQGQAEVLRPLLRHGILQQRTADLVTDAFRALALRIMGYRTEVIEFISTEHTARNLMLRAVVGAPVGEAAFVKEYVEMGRFWGVTPYIETALGEGFRKLLTTRGQIRPVS